MNFSLDIQIPPSLLQLEGKELMAALFRNAEALAQQEEQYTVARVYERAYATGTLAHSVKADVTGRGGMSAGSVLLATITANTFEEAGRDYAPYQEGPPLGLATYTNPPRHFLFDIETEDAASITTWAEDTLRAAIAEMESGTLAGE